MRSRKIILSMAMAGVLLTGCASVNNQNEVAEQTPEITIEATEAETETEGKVVMSKEQTDEFIMNRIWEESWLKGYGKILYPDFEMSYYYYPGYNYDFRSLKTDDGIEV